MKNIRNISNTFEDTLKDSNLHIVASGISEVLIDGVLNEGLLRDFPIIGSIIGIGKLGLKVNDLLFLKKVAYFFTEIKDIDAKKRSEMISKIDDSKKFRIKVGEKLLYLIDKSEDHIKAEYHAKLFRAFIEKQISYSEFLRSTSIIQKLLIEDLEFFLSLNSWDDRNKKNLDIDLNDFENSLVNAGICYLEVDPVTVNDQADYKMNEKYVVEGGEASTYTTKIGDRIKEVLNNSNSKK